MSLFTIDRLKEVFSESAKRVILYFVHYHWKQVLYLALRRTSETMSSNFMVPARMGVTVEIAPHPYS